MKGKNTISTFELFELFPDQEAARIYLEGRLWPDGVRCSCCGLPDRITTRKGGYYRCNLSSKAQASREKEEDQAPEEMNHGSQVCNSLYEAAPNLLEALENIAAYCGASAKYAAGASKDTLAKAASDARAAIAKATR